MFYEKNTIQGEGCSEAEKNGPHKNDYYILIDASPCVMWFVEYRDVITSFG